MTDPVTHQKKKALAALARKVEALERFMDALADRVAFPPVLLKQEAANGVTYFATGSNLNSGRPIG